MEKELEKYYEMAKKFNQDRYGVTEWVKQREELAKKQKEDPEATYAYIGLSEPGYYLWEDTVVALMFQLQELFKNKG